MKKQHYIYTLKACVSVQSEDFWEQVNVLIWNYAKNFEKKIEKFHSGSKEIEMGETDEMRSCIGLKTAVRHGWLLSNMEKDISNLSSG
jgi:hypothetical protein